MIYDRNADKPGRKPNFWVRYQVNGREYREPGKGSLRATRAFAAELQRAIKLGTWIPPQKRNAADPLFADYALTVINRRVKRGVVTAHKDERGHVVNHLAPVFGKLRMRELSFVVVKNGFANSINVKGLGGRTVRNIHATLRQIFVEAEEDGILDAAPSPLKVARDHIPPPLDKDPTWRATAKFETSEVAELIGCDAIPSWRRVMYATCFATGSRFQEILPLKVSDYRRELRPLACLSVKASKLGRHREVSKRHAPVLPELGAWLDWWLDSEYEILFGRRPKPADLLFPTMSQRRRDMGLRQCTYNEIMHHWRRNDLVVAGLKLDREVPAGAPNRGRGLHDPRRTLIGLLRSAGVDDRHVRAVTHGGSGDAVLDAYTHYQWEALCRAVSVVSFGLPRPPGSVIEIGTRSKTKEA